MTQATLRNRIQRIQTHLGVPADGLVGPTTLTALENALFEDSQREAAVENFSLAVSRKGLKQLVKHEISSAAYYKKFLSHPIWPGGNSGVTIGIGYDLGQNSEKQIRKDWTGKLSEIDLEKLIVVSGLKGDTAKHALNGVRSITVPLEKAQEVFYGSTLTRYAASTLKTYPGVEKLFPDAQAGLLSLIYNRGTSFKGPNRKEMAEIKPLVEQQDYAGISLQIKTMKRLWEDKGLDGLLKRRDDEAKLISQSGRAYEASEIVRI
jgi:GH24 family phage-related lysozyme (muramidase)